MNHKKNKIEIYNKNNLIITLDTDNPDLTKLVEAIVQGDINHEDIICKTEIENFDTESFQEIIRNTIKSINIDLENELNQFEEIVGSIVVDDDAITYFKNIIDNK